MPSPSGSAMACAIFCASITSYSVNMRSSSSTFQRAAMLYGVVPSMLFCSTEVGSKRITSEPAECRNPLLSSKFSHLISFVAVLCGYDNKVVMTGPTPLPLREGAKQSKCTGSLERMILRPADVSSAPMHGPLALWCMCCRFQKGPSRRLYEISPSASPSLSVAHGGGP